MSSMKKVRTIMAVNRKLLPLKVLLLLMFGAMSSLYPFMTIHMVSLGISYSEIAVIYAILPFVCFIGPPIGGWLADRLGNYRLVFVMFSLFCVVTHLLLWFGVPSAAPRRSIDQIPLTNMRISFVCSQEKHSFDITTDLVLNETCKLDPSVVETVSFLRCSTNCPSAKLCFTGPNHQDCSQISEMEGRYISNGALVLQNNSLILTNFTSEEKNAVNSISCLADQSAHCDASCDVQVKINVTCSKMVSSGDKKTTLALYVLFRYLAGVGLNTVSPILDAIAYQMSKEHGGDLGFQRAFALIGMAAFPPISGLLIDVASTRSGTKDFSPAFIGFAAMFTIAAIIAYFMSLQLKMPGEHIMKNMRRILMNPKVTMFIVMMFLIGCFWGFLENFLFVFMEEIGSKRWLLGMTATVSALSALPVVACSTVIMRYMGHTKIIAICAILYGVRFIGYSFVYDPFLILPVEVLEAFTTSLLWVVASVYCGKVAPDYLATLQGIISGAHAAIGRGFGSLIGGIMFDKMNKRVTYQIWGVFCITVGFLYLLLHFCWLRKLSHSEPSTESASANAEENHKLSPAMELEVEKAAKSAGYLQAVRRTSEAVRFGSFEDLQELPPTYERVASSNNQDSAL